MFQPRKSVGLALAIPLWDIALCFSCISNASHWLLVSILVSSHDCHDVTFNDSTSNSGMGSCQYSSNEHQRRLVRDMNKLLILEARSVSLLEL